MDLFKGFYDKRVKDFHVTVSRDESSQKIWLTVRHRVRSNLFTIVRRFNTERDYERFLAEAVILRASADKSSVHKARKILQNICGYMLDEGYSTTIEKIN